MFELKYVLMMGFKVIKNRTILMYLRFQQIECSGIWGRVDR